MSAPDWQPQLARLLADGAEIEVTDIDGTTRRWPLARHYRFNDDGRCVWLRPITGQAHRAGSRPPAFAHEHARRRPLRWTAVNRGDRRLTLRTPAGQRVTIRPVGADLGARLDDWDTFVGTVLSAAVETDLDLLEEDSW